MRSQTKQLSMEWKLRMDPRLYLLLITIFLLSVSYSQTGNLVEISGQVTDQEKNAPLPDVSVQIKGTISGTTTNASGNFVLRTRTKLPFTIVFSSIGFK